MMTILFVALVPPLFLMVRIFQHDKIEKEPVGLVAKVFFGGCLSTVAAGIFEEIGAVVLNTTGLHYSSYLYQLLMNFLVIGLSEEGVKRLVTRRNTWNHPEFNYLFDGVVYAVAAALGFAAAENVMYVAGFGLGVGPIRAVTAIPLHCITGIFMGHFYGQAKYAEVMGDLRGLRRNMAASLWLPVFIHGFYDFCASYESEVLSAVFLVFIVVLDIAAFRAVRRYSRGDVGF